MLEKSNIYLRASNARNIMQSHHAKKKHHKKKCYEKWFDQK